VSRGPRRWGGLARRGAGRALGESASDAWRSVGRDAGGAAGQEPSPDSERWQPEEWIDEGEMRDEAEEAVGRGREPDRPRLSGAGPGGGRDRGRDTPDRGRDRPGGSRRPRQSQPDAAEAGTGDAPADEAIRRAVPPNRMTRFEARLNEATDAFRRERYEDARRILRPLAEQAPGATPVRELYGLTLYRLGRWAQAKRELEAFRTQTNSVEQHPVLADCYRALGKYGEVEELWDELRAASPSAELVAEGRIVAAGALADQGSLDDAIAVLEAAAKPTKRPKQHHLRLAYALADLYERAGEAPQARELFGRVAASDPDFVDVQARLRALR
jgi:thioredoxin-like negative regulator of GroEL